MRNRMVVLLALVALLVALSTPAGARAAAGRPGGNRRAVQSVTVTVTDDGYQPSAVRLRKGIPARITFIRRTEMTCGTPVVFPALGIRRELPLDEPVTIRFTPRRAGRLRFACGMDMWHGALIVR